MKIVIDIPEELYEKQLSNDWSGNIYIHDAIVNGTPLPKGHGNLIQREEAEAIFRNAKMALYKQSHTEQIKDFQTRELMLLNAEQFVHLIKPIIEADKAESEDKLDGDPIDIDKAVEHYEGTLEVIKDIDLEVDE